ncbi:hypothetical protein WEU38_15230 [Cyanobacterium aponinum AL20118]|uniref:DUF3047 domain-containing protein n=1 Tax=Cyanobacterium aponinum AL20115 TaxID=3090662 RepID=A0AAF1C536_9CHRO|nr:hypothetical protein [Cyanobacterium aponinum]MBD2395016.1 hypothetical protein [Cyanobacterium aponinum FACHB-4101]WPF88151.1 hypothetical protein SAY89_15305 [Cyanobacterium aponinum AL20115]
MNRSITQTVLSLIAVLTLNFPAMAKVQPSPINQDSSVPWSKVTEDSFEGKIVYDKDFGGFGESYAIVSSWSKQAIRLSYFWQIKEVDYYKQVKRTRSVWRNNKYEEEVYWDREPVYKYSWKSKNPEYIMFSINGQLYEYQGGKISDDLMSALANAPSTNLKIRLVWSDGSTTDATIGSGTVNAWKTIYQMNSQE